MVRLHTRERLFGVLYGKIKHKRNRAQKNLSLVFNLTIQGTEESFLCLILPYKAQKNLSLVFSLTIQGTEESFY
jgi:hypothetical protein